MSREQATLTRAEAIRRRREEEEKRRENDTRQRAIKPKLPPKQAKTDRPKISLTPASTGRLRRRYDIAMSAPYGRGLRRSGRTIQLPEITLPRLSFGPRWISFLLMSACLFLIYGMYTTDAYLVQSVTVTGNQRIRTDEIEMVIGIWNQPSFVVNPAQVEYNLLASYPELVSVRVHVGLPAEITIQVQERMPAISWEQAGQVVWVDAQGYSFPPRGVVDDLAIVTAMGLPPLPPDAESAPAIGARPFMTPELTRSVMTLYPTMPEGASLVYDPQYGLGWQDPLGWQVYFGQSGDDMQTKLNVYLTIVEYLLKRNIQPALISVEYPSAPFYRMAD
jgi:hypothetical protein